MSLFSLLFPDADAKLDQILSAVSIVKRKEFELMVDVSKITASVARNASLTDSVLTLLSQLNDQIKAVSQQLADALAANDPAAAKAAQDQLDALTQAIDAESDKLAAAVPQNTPAG